MGTKRHRSVAWGDSLSPPMAQNTEEKQTSSKRTRASDRVAWRNEYIHWWERQKSSWWSREGYIRWQKEELKGDEEQAAYDWDCMYATALVCSPEKTRLMEVQGHGKNMYRYPMVLVDMMKYNRLEKDGSVKPDMKKEKEIEAYLDLVWGKYCLTDTKKSSDTQRGGRPMLRSSEEAVVVLREGYISSPS